MRNVPTGRTRHETREISDVSVCAGCGQAFEPKLHTTSWRNCMCPAPHYSGHRIWICLRPDCDRAQTLDPPCTGQHGPTASYGA